MRSELMKHCFLVIVFLSLALAAAAQAGSEPRVSNDDPANGIEEVYLARDDGHGKAGEPVSSFVTTDIPIYCIVKLSSSKPVIVKMNFVAVTVSGVKPETRVVSVSYSTKDGQDRVNFAGRPAGKWNAGKYRVDIFIDGTLAKNLVFDILSAKAANVKTGKLTK